MIYYFKRYWKLISLLIVVLITLIISLINYYFGKEKKEDVTIVKENFTEKKENNNLNDIKTVFVDVKGAVNQPGVYEIDEERRIIDAINLAGGLSDNADTINLNLSKKVKDEMYIVIYTKEEIYNYKLNNEIKNEPIVCASLECDCPDTSNDACIKEENSNKQDALNKISINTATKEELMKLSGIGESKANAIISYREENGDFKSLEDIKNVSGIGESLYEKIKDNITL